MGRKLLDFVLTGRWVSYFYIAIVAITGFEVVMRYFFLSPTIWVHETSMMLGSSAFLIGGIYVLRSNDHIRITFLYEICPPRGRWWLDRLANLICAAYLGLLAWSAYGVMRLSWRFGETTGTAWDPPLPIILKTVLFAVAVIMALTCALRTFGLARPTPAEED